MIMDSCASWKDFTKRMSRTTPKTNCRNPQISNISSDFVLLSSVSPMPLIRFDARSNFIDVRDERKFIIYEKYPFLSSFPLSWVFKNLLEF